MTNKLKGYFWKDHTDAEYGLAVVAKNSKRAKELGYAYWASDVGVEHDTWITQRVKWNKNAKIEDIDKECVIEPLDGLKRGIYGWIEDYECEICGSCTTLYNCEDKALCSDCEEKIQEMGSNFERGE